MSKYYEPWRWGVWKHRPDLPQPTSTGDQHYPIYEFTESKGGDDALVLSNKPYGTIEDREKILNVMESVSTDYGGETTIMISPENMARIVECVNALEGCPDPKAFIEAVKKIGEKIQEAGLDSFMDVPDIRNPDTFDGVDFLNESEFRWLKIKP